MKARTCDTLNWPEFPEKNNEFRDLTSFRTHNLDILLRLSGLEAQIKQAHIGDWSIVTTWNPEARYQPIGHVDSARAPSMIESRNPELAAILSSFSTIHSNPAVEIKDGIFFGLAIKHAYIITSQLLADDSTWLQRKPEPERKDQPA